MCIANQPGPERDVFHAAPLHTVRIAGSNLTDYANPSRPSGIILIV